MNNENQCSVVSDLLPLYAEGLTSEKTNTFIQEHLKECSNCQKEYLALKTELRTATERTSKRELNYLKKINTYQNINLVLGAIISFLFGTCMPVFKYGISVILGGGILDYHLKRLQVLWPVVLLKMILFGVIVCGCYLILMLLIRKRMKYK